VHYAVSAVMTGYCCAAKANTTTVVLSLLETADVAHYHVICSFVTTLTQSRATHITSGPGSGRSRSEEGDRPVDNKFATYSVKVRYLGASSTIALEVKL